MCKFLVHERNSRVGVEQEQNVRCRSDRINKKFNGEKDISYSQLTELYPTMKLVSQPQANISY